MRASVATDRLTVANPVSVATITSATISSISVKPPTRRSGVRGPVADIGIDALAAGLAVPAL